MGVSSTDHTPSLVTHDSQHKLLEKEEHEPLLKYQRIGKHLKRFIQDDHCSCFAVHRHFVVLGTISGAVHVFDLHGAHIRRLHTHVKRVNDISIDTSGQNIATASDDGVVAINQGFKILHDDEKLERGTASGPSSVIAEETIVQYYNPVYSCQWQPITTMTNLKEKVYATGGIAGQVVVNKRGWIMQKEYTVHEGEGPIDCIRWNGHVIAWSNDWGVKVYDTKYDRKLAYVERPMNCPAFEFVRCHLMWEDPETLIIGWGDCIKMMKIQPCVEGDDLEKEEQPEPPQVSHRAEIVTVIHTDYFISGLSPWSNDAFVVLAYHPPKEEEDQDSSSFSSSSVMYPEIRLLSKTSGETLASDAVPIRGSGPRLRASDLRLISSHGQTTGLPVLYIMAPTDLILVRALDVDDQVSWALERRLYARAMSFVKPDDVVLRHHDMLHDVVRRYLHSLFAEERYAMTATELEALLGGSGSGSSSITNRIDVSEQKQEWERWIWIFAQQSQLSEIAHVVPTHEPRLDLNQYDMILHHLLHEAPRQLLEIIQKWPKPRLGDAIPNQESKDDDDDDDEYQVENQGDPNHYHRSSNVFEPLYNIQEWIERLETRVREEQLSKVENSSTKTNDDDRHYIMETLAELYKATEQYHEALALYLTLSTEGHKLYSTNHHHHPLVMMDDSETTHDHGYHPIFRMIIDEELWADVQDAQVLTLVFLMHQTLAIRMFVDYVEHFDIEMIVSQIQTYENHHEVLYAYLHDFFVHRMGTYNQEAFGPYHDLHVRLAAQVDPEELLPFVRTSDFVSFQQAYECCLAQDPPLWEAIIYLLGKMGNHRNALDIILNQLGNVEQAIEFVQTHPEDPSLWDRLIELSLTRPEFIAELLEFACHQKFDPRQLIAAIPAELPIVQLKVKLERILGTFALQLALYEGCQRSFDADRFKLVEQSRVIHARGWLVPNHSKCSICRLDLRKLPRKYIVKLPSGYRQRRHVAHHHHRIMIFPCRHAFHLDCLEEKQNHWKCRLPLTGGFPKREKLQCSVCHAQYLEEDDEETESLPKSKSSPRVKKINMVPPRGLTELDMTQARAKMSATTLQDD